MVENKSDWYKDLNRKQKLDLRQCLIDGVPLYQVAKMFNVSATAIGNRYSDLLEQLSFKKDGSNASIGHKNVAYYTEQEALTTPSYNYKNLSETEKQIYDDKENSTLE